MSSGKCTTPQHKMLYLLLESQPAENIAIYLGRFHDRFVLSYQFCCSSRRRTATLEDIHCFTGTSTLCITKPHPSSSHCLKAKASRLPHISLFSPRLANTTSQRRTGIRIRDDGSSGFDGVINGPASQSIPVNA